MRQIWIALLAAAIAVVLATPRSGFRRGTKDEEDEI
jgi:hypothetical protein